MPAPTLRTWTGTWSQDVMAAMDVAAEAPAGSTVTVSGGTYNVTGPEGRPSVPSGASPGPTYPSRGPEDRPSVPPQPVPVGTGSEGNDVLVGSSVNDHLRGLGGNDTIMGGAGNDVLVGDGGDDRIIGGPGRDVVYGMTGSDVFMFGFGESGGMDTGAGMGVRDVISDFDQGQDRIDLVYYGVGMEDLSFELLPNSTIVTINAGGQVGEIELMGRVVALQESDFIFG